MSTGEAGGTGGERLGLRLSELRATLRSMELRPSRAMGQSFLHDANMARWIVAHAGVIPGVRVVEIGPGFGALTEWLVEAGARVLAIERDARLAEWMRARFGGAGVEVVCGDAQRYDIRPLFAGGPISLVSNLPYSVSSQLLFRWLDAPTPVAGATVTVQRELAERIVARPGCADYGILTLMLGRRWRAEMLRILPASLFYPEPKVESAVVRFLPRPLVEGEACDEGIWRRLIQEGFHQRRKQLGNALGDEGLDWGAVERETGVGRALRAADVTPEMWVALARHVERRSGAGEGTGRVGEEEFDVVDAGDRVVGRAPRSEVHERGMLHRSAHIFVLNRRGEVYLQLRAGWKDRHPGVWDSSAAGHLDAGEEYGVAARREVFEELGIEVDPEEVASIAAEERTGWEFVRLYRAWHDGPIRPGPGEIDCGAFFPLELVERWASARPEDFAPGFLTCLERYRRALAKRPS